MATQPTTRLDSTTVDDGSFDKLVNQEAREQASPEIAAFLRSPEVVDRWYESLRRLKLNIEVQLIGKKAELAEAKVAAWKLGPTGKAVWLQEVATYEKWRAGAIRVLAKGLESRLAEAKRLRQCVRSKAFAGNLVAERDAARTKVRALRQLILEHRDHVCGDACSDSVCIADEALWKAVNED